MRSPESYILLLPEKRLARGGGRDFQALLLEHLGEAPAHQELNTRDPRDQFGVGDDASIIAEQASQFPGHDSSAAARIQNPQELSRRNMLLEKKGMEKVLHMRFDVFDPDKIIFKSSSRRAAPPLEIDLTILSNWFSNIIKPLTGEMVGPECGREENVNPIIQINSPRRLLWIGR